MAVNLTKFIFRNDDKSGYKEQALSALELDSLKIETELTLPSMALDSSAAATAAATKGYVDAIAGQIRGQSDATSGQIAYSLSNLRKYVDENVQGLDVKASVKAHASTNVAVAPGNRTELTVDSVALAVGDRVLLTGQTDKKQNGIYVVKSDWDLARAADASDQTDNASLSDMSAIPEVSIGLFTFVEEGNVHAATGWVLSAATALTDGKIVLGTSELTFTQFSGAGLITAGAGLAKSGNTLSVNAGNGIAVNADSDDAVSVKFAASSGLEFVNTDELDIALRAGGVISKADGIDVDIASGLEKVEGALDLALDAAAPFSKAAGLKLELGTNPGLKIESQKLAAKIDGAGGLKSVSDGLAVKIASADELASDSSGLAVVGVPAEFKLAGNAVSANVTQANVDKLVDGKDASTLHVHGGTACDIVSTLTADSKKAIALGASDYEVAAITGTVSAHKTIGFAVGSADASGSIRVATSGVVKNFFGADKSGIVYIKNDGSVQLYSDLALPTSGSYRLVRAGFAKGRDLHIAILDLGEVVL